MSSKPAKNIAEDQNKNQIENIKEYWTEHRTTLIAFEAQYIYGKKPEVADDEDSDHKNRKGKKKDIEYDGGFLFPGRNEEKEVNVVEMIREFNKHSNLKDLFDDNINHPEDILELREFVKIMLELKHPCIVKEFLDIYEIIIKEIKDVKFEQIKIETDRFNVINKIAQKVSGYVMSYLHNLKNFAGYMKDDKKETIKLFKVTTYCFLAEKYNFNINEFYSDAFEFQQTQKKVPKKKKKTDKEEMDS